jgi:hypothetical protein
MNVLMREILPRLAGPVIEQAWVHLTGSAAGVPHLDVRIEPAVGS